MRTIRRAAAYATAAAFLFCYCAAAGAQGVMDQVPSDALAVLKINRLEQTNQKVGKWTQALGIAQLSPDAADPLGSIQNKLNIKNGLDRNGDAAVVFLDPGKAAGSARARGGDDAGDDGGAGGADKAMLILVPVTDYKAFVGQLPNANAKGAITSFRPEDANEDVYCANWGKYAALSPSQAALQNKPQGGMKTTGMAARELKDKDIVLYANLPAIKTRALPHLQKLREQMKQQMAAGGGAGAGAGENEGNNVSRPATPRRGGAQRGGAGAGGARRPTPPPPPEDRDNSADNLQISFQEQAGGERQPQPQQSRRAQAQPRRPQAQQQDADTANNDAGNANTDESNPASARSNRRGGARRGGAGAAGGMDPAMAQYMGAMIDQYFGMAERFLNDGQAATVGLSFNDQGLNTTALAEFTPNSELGNIVQGLKNTDQNLLAGLPDRKYFAFAGGTVSPKAYEQIITDLVQPMLQQLSAAQGQGQAKVDSQALTDAMKQIVQNAKTVSVGYTVPTGALGADSIIQAVTVVNGNAKAIAEAERKILSNMGNMFQMPAGAGAGAPQMSFDIQEGAKTVGGVKLDQYKFNIEMDANNDPRAAQAQQMMAMIYGPNGMSGVMGVVDDNTFLVVQGGTDKLVADAVASAKAKQDTLSRSQQVQAVRGQLPKQRIFEGYLALDNVIRSGVQYAQGFGLPVKLQLKPNLPPIGGSVASEGTSIRMDSHVPTSLLQNVISAGMQAYTQMQGGGAGGNPDGL